MADRQVLGPNPGAPFVHPGNISPVTHGRDIVSSAGSTAAIIIAQACWTSSDSRLGEAKDSVTEWLR